MDLVSYLESLPEIKAYDVASRRALIQTHLSASAFSDLDGEGKIDYSGNCLQFATRFHILLKYYSQTEYDSFSTSLMPPA